MGSARRVFFLAFLLLAGAGLASAQASTSAQSVQPLPQAPSAVLPIEKYQPYSKPTRRENLDAYRRS